MAALQHPRRGQQNRQPTPTDVLEMAGMTRTPGTAPVSVSFCAPQNRKAILWAAILASSMGFIDSSVTAIAIPAMRSALGATLPQAQWISAAYLLAVSALVLTGGALGDRYGTAKVFVIGIWIFIVASLGCALAQDAPQMIAARAIKGIGAALMVPGSMALVSRAYPKEERGQALGLWAAASTATTALGPVLGGMLISWGGELGWRAIFAMNLPLGLISVWLLRNRIARDATQSTTALDLPGALLATAGLGLMALALTSRSELILPLGAAGLAAFTAFIWWEAVSPAPMIRLLMFRRRTFAMANLMTLALYFALNGVMFYLPMTATSVWGVSALEITAAFVPISVLIGVMSAPAGRWADRFGPGPLLAIGSALVALAYAGLAFFAEAGNFWGRIIPLMTLGGVGLGLLVAPLTAAVMADAGDDEQGAASGINNAIARVAGLIAVALMGRLAAWSYGAVNDPSLPGFGVPGSTTAHVAATSHAFALVAGIAAAMALVAAILSAVTIRGGKPGPSA